MAGSPLDCPTYAIEREDSNLAIPALLFPTKRQTISQGVEMLLQLVCPAKMIFQEDPFDAAPDLRSRAEYNVVFASFAIQF